MFGGLNYSIQVAAEMANLDAYNLIEYPKQENFLNVILDIEGVKQTLLKKNLGSNYNYYKTLNSLINSQGILMRLPAEISIN